MSVESEKAAVEERATEETNAFRAYLASAGFIIAMNIERLTGDRESFIMVHLRSTRCS